MSEHPRNIAWRLSEMFVTSKLTILTTLAITIFGAVAIYLTPREENPQLIVPSAQITVQLPGASSLEVENLIVTPLEGIVSEIVGVDHTQAVAMNSVGIVGVQFKAGENKEDSLVKLYNRVLSNLDRLPEGASAPLIKALDVDDMPVVTVTLASNNLSIPVGDTVRDANFQAVFLEGFFKNADDVRGLVVGQNDGRPIYLGDISDIVDGPPLERQKISRFSFGAGDARFSEAGNQDLAAVTLGIAKEQGTNAVFMADDVIARIKHMQDEFVPRDVHVVVTRNDGQKADAAVNILIEHMGIAVSTVFLILILFLGWKEALIVTLSIPLVQFVTMGADFIADVTINRVSLFALTLSLGLLVDDAIVVIENIHRRYHNGGAARRKRSQSGPAPRPEVPPTWQPQRSWLSLSHWCWSVECRGIGSWGQIFRQHPWSASSHLPVSQSEVRF